MLPQNIWPFAIGVLVIALVMAWLVSRVDSDGQRERSLIHFAAVILTPLALIFLLSMAMYYCGSGGKDGPGAEIFDRCAQIIPPIVTLVVGYFFGRQEVDRGSRRDQNSPAKQRIPDAHYDKKEGGRPAWLSMR